MLLMTIPARPDIEKLMSEHGDSLLRLCFIYLKDYQLAEDAVQETFIRAYTKYHTFAGASTEKTWLTRIAINICKDFLRRKSFGERAMGDDFPDSADEAPTPEERAVEDDRNQKLYTAVCGLDPIYREVVMLFYYSGLKVQEIARILKTREGTVKTRLMRARSRLGEALEEDYL